MPQIALTNLLTTKNNKMDFLPKNKWLALLVFIVIVMVAVIAALSFTKLVPNTKEAGTMRFKLGAARARKA